MTLLSVADATTRLLNGVQPLATEYVSLGQSAGRILAASLAALYTQPPFDASAMDGYAVRSADVLPVPATLSCIGESAAGRGYNGRLAAGEAVRIFTGAPIPAGADAIVIQENCRRDGNVVQVVDGTPDKSHVRRRGGDFDIGATLLEAGRRLGPREITLAAAMGHSALNVHRRPIVAILATGDELVMPGTTPGADQIVCSNPFGVAALVEQAGGTARLLGIATDTRDSLNAHIDAAHGADILITIGGASVGDHDLIAPVLQARGMTLDFWKIAMRPGKPLLFGRLGDQRVVGLPGNPVSALICTRVFIVPMIRALTGVASTGELDLATAIAAVAIEANGPRTHYMRATLEPTPSGARAARPVRSQDSSLLAPLAAADCLIVRAPNAASALPGDRLDILHLDF